MRRSLTVPSGCKSRLPANSTSGVSENSRSLAFNPRWEFRQMSTGSQSQLRKAAGPLIQPTSNTTTTHALQKKISHRRIATFFLCPNPLSTTEV
jgi:hypothetical protein